MSRFSIDSRANYNSGEEIRAIEKEIKGVSSMLNTIEKPLLDSNVISKKRLSSIKTKMGHIQRDVSAFGNGIESITDKYDFAEKRILENDVRRRNACHKPKQQHVPEGTEELHVFLSNNDVNMLFGGYNYAATFIMNLDPLEEIAYLAGSIRKMLLALLTGSLSGKDFQDAVANAYLNDPTMCRAVIADILKEWTYDKDQMLLDPDLLSQAKKMADYSIFGFDKETTEFIKDAVDTLGIVNANAVISEYRSNIEILESIKRGLGDNTALSSTVNQLLFEYKTYSREWMDGISSKIQDAGATALELITDMPFVSVSKMIEKVAGHTPAAQGIGQVVSTTELISNSMQSLQESAEKIASGVYTDADVGTYTNTFNLVKSLKITQYEGMLKLAESGSREYMFLSNEIAKLKLVEPDGRWMMASSLSSWDGSTIISSGGGGGGSFGSSIGGGSFGGR